ncbi:MAG: vWA domain-containing protein [Nanoarchaeota archaeon]
MKKVIKNTIKKNRIIREKESVSDILVVLLFIILGIMALGIIFLIAKNFIIENKEISEVKVRFFTETIEVTGSEFNPFDLSQMNMTITKKSGKVELVGTETTTKIISPVIDVISVADLSSSMAGPKLTASKAANIALINSILTRNENRMGLVAYSSIVSPGNSSDLTRDSNLLNNIVNNWTLGSGTRICKGIEEAMKKFQVQSSQSSTKIMVVMSDGQATRDCTGGNNAAKARQDAIDAACIANSTLDNLVIYSIGFNLQGDPLAQNTMNQIAQCGNGKYFEAAQISDLIDIYDLVVEEIESKIFKSLKVIGGLKVVFYNSTDSYSELITDVPLEIFETKKYQFYNRITNLERIEIYPVITTSSGKEVIGPLIWIKEF